MKLEKVYKVTFMNYTSALKDTVSDWDGNPSNLSNATYLKVTSSPFLLRESELSKYKCYGGGLRDILFVGNLPSDTEN